MNFSKIIIKSFTVMLLYSFIMVSCILQGLNSDINDTDMKGTLRGKISIGPLCPVETNPPLPECLPTEETYKIWAVAVWSADKRIKIEVIKPNLDGTFKLELPINDYIIDYDTRQNFSVNSSNLPIKITIVPNDVTEINIEIDTGIR